jgi:hypothetical protein
VNAAILIRQIRETDMRFSRRDILARLPGVAWGGAALLSAGPSWAADAAGQVASLRGQAFAEGAEPRRALRVPSPVFLKEFIITDESARLALQLMRDVETQDRASARRRH